MCPAFACLRYVRHQTQIFCGSHFNLSQGCCIRLFLIQTTPKLLYGILGCWPCYLSEHEFQVNLDYGCLSPQLRTEATINHELTRAQTDKRHRCPMADAATGLPFARASQ